MSKHVQQLGKYDFLGEVGRGAFTIVYHARDTILGREVALKILQPEHSNNTDVLQRFREKARTLAILNHPNIVILFEYEDSQSTVQQPYMTMQLVQGHSLAREIAKRNSQQKGYWARALLLINKICAALSYAHSVGVVHGDLKPANILLNLKTKGKPFPMLTDFGQAHHLVEDNKISYMAPEVWEGGEVNEQVDVYALGCIIYEMLTGEVLFRGDNPEQVRYAHEQGPLFPSLWPPEIPAGIADVLCKALARRPVDRYQNVQSLLDALHVLDAQIAQLRADARNAITAESWEQAKTLLTELFAISRDDPVGRALREKLPAVLSQERLRQRFDLDLKIAHALALVPLISMVIGRADSKASERIHKFASDLIHRHADTQNHVDALNLSLAQACECSRYLANSLTYARKLILALEHDYDHDLNFTDVNVTRRLKARIEGLKHARDTAQQLSDALNRAWDARNRANLPIPDFTRDPRRIQDAEHGPRIIKRIDEVLEANTSSDGDERGINRNRHLANASKEIHEEVNTLLRNLLLLYPDTCAYASAYSYILIAGDEITSARVSALSLISALALKNILAGSNTDSNSIIEPPSTSSSAKRLAGYMKHTEVHKHSLDHITSMNNDLEVASAGDHLLSRQDLYRSDLAKAFNDVLASDPALALPATLEVALDSDSKGRLRRPDEARSARWYARLYALVLALIYAERVSPFDIRQEAQRRCKGYLDLYVGLVLLEERIEHNLLVFEGIRIVQEK